MGIKGTTSVAPMRGCAPECFVRSISSAAFPTPRRAASATASGSPGQRHDAAVMVRIALTVEQEHTRNFAHRSDDCVDFRGITAFGKIRHTLDESFHEIQLLEWMTVPRFIVRLQRFTPK